MIDNESKNILMLGLPESGKTTFLAAFSHYIGAEIPGRNLIQYKLSSNTTYITSIVQSWLKGAHIERTKVTASQNSNTMADIYIENKLSKKRATLHIPDFYGETFQTQFLTREIEVDYIKQIKELAGILLFVHPEKIKDPVLIEDIQIAYRVEEMINNADVESRSSNQPPEKSTQTEPFNLEEVPTQVVIVDLLESHLEYTSQRPVNIAVIVSAWDIVSEKHESMSPLKWLEKMLPLLYQFLTSNTERIKLKCIGISAQGGNIEDNAVVKRLTDIDEPAERIIVHEDETVHHNIASPVEWILEQC